ncbi:hypothetical protein PPERSA_01559 [Pseudocohnilembus persalinus]|uniref:Uncharacterized protein n=1 Tax=Pseudocohnilembus persalinus TaxID=266149 RepID=A0A0V0QHH5_PSEPJ|nr:hypothetical protein PPERSA_01559 [Pseudocohnilembus persalinus]|eukprot:KRX01689.1 hypothetical protein PPERSA_01559 [Pseudocohnilembus persalinus]
MIEQEQNIYSQQNKYFEADKIISNDNFKVVDGITYYKKLKIQNVHFFAYCTNKSICKYCSNFKEIPKNEIVFDQYTISDIPQNNIDLIYLNQINQTDDRLTKIKKNEDYKVNEQNKNLDIQSQIILKKPNNNLQKQVQIEQGQQDKQNDIQQEQSLQRENLENFLIQRSMNYYLNKNISSQAA